MIHSEIRGEDFRDFAVWLLSQRSFWTKCHQSLDCAAGAPECPFLECCGDAEKGQKNRPLKWGAHGSRGYGGHHHEQVDV